MIKDKKKKTYSFFFGFNQGRNKPTLAGGQKKFSKKLNKFFNVIKQLLIKYKILSNNYFFFYKAMVHACPLIHPSLNLTMCSSNTKQNRM